MRRRRPNNPQRLLDYNRRPTIPGCPFEAAEDYEFKAWHRLRELRQWSPRRIMTGLKIRKLKEKEGDQDAHP